MTIMLLPFWIMGAPLVVLVIDGLMSRGNRNAEPIPHRGPVEYQHGATPPAAA